MRRAPRQAAIETAASRLLRGVEVSFAVVGIFLFSGALVPLLLRELAGVSLSSGAGNPVLRMTYGAIHAGTLLLVLLRWRSVKEAALRHKPTLALLALAIASALWSTDPDLTLRRSIAFLATSAFGLFLAARFETRSLLKVMAVTFGTIALLSIVFAVALPELGRDVGENAGDWRGIFNQKNNLAQAMVLGAVVFLLLRRQVLRGRWVITLGAVVCCGVMLMTTSATAPAVLLTLVAMVPLLRAIRWRSTLVVPVLLGSLLTASLAALWFLQVKDEILVSLGKDPTLTGRTPMWEAVTDMIAREPLLGYGYSAFWTGWNGPAREVWRAIGWTTPNAHSGYLDLALQLGLVGLLVFAVGFAVAAGRAIRIAREYRTSLSLWPPLLLAYVFLYNFTETTLLQQNTLIWALYVATVCLAPPRRPDAAATAGPS